ncbi:FadR family transcriptional regulator [Marinobacterium sp. D7]|uniref:FadR/GntR family transcriptional regulator n=1 Tax=Marinobacterium ramblicola TaxID=2849041 RepID=UPI001C2DB636|nr:FadR/GntR family transcriptional regulator [Marinobacterium ramblicola]MBV1790130.1 FadR family transcriptional regulator [Marinobacterium ramblicola]
MGNPSAAGGSFNVEPVRRSESLASHVAKQLEQMITQGHIPVGDKLPTEAQLCDMFAVSRTVIREAITQLKSLGLVETRRGVGTTVMRSQPAETLFAYTINPTAVEDILNILELRMCVEEKAAEMAAMRRTEQDIERLEQSLSAFDAALAKGELAREEDLAFHLAIASATGNHFFRQFYEQFNKNIIPRAKIVNTNLDRPATEEYLERVRQEHRAIFDAIREGEPEKASKAMHTHLYRAYHLYEKYRTSQQFE